MRTIDDIQADRDDVNDSVLHVKQELASSIDSIRWIMKTAYFSDVRTQRRFVELSQELRAKAIDLELAANALIAYAHNEMLNKIDDEISKVISEVA